MELNCYVGIHAMATCRGGIQPFAQKKITFATTVTFRDPETTSLKTSMPWRHALVFKSRFPCKMPQALLTPIFFRRSNLSSQP